MENDVMAMTRGVVIAAGASLLMGLSSSVAPVWALNDEVSSRAI